MKFRRPGIAHVDITERNAVEGRGSRPARSSVKKWPGVDTTGTIPRNYVQRAERL